MKHINNENTNIPNRYAYGDDPFRWKHKHVQQQQYKDYHKLPDLKKWNML
jgi:hypothetical protein